MGMSSPGSSAPSINVTPLIDVLLVLLVIFLLIMPVMQKLEAVSLPPNEPAEPQKPPVVIKLHADATASIDEGAPFRSNELAALLDRKVGRDSTVFVDFEDGVLWSDVLVTVDTVRGAVPDPESIHVPVRIHE